MPILTMRRTLFPGVPFPLSSAHTIGKHSHFLQHGVHLGHHIFAIDDDRRPSGRPQGHVQHRSLLGDVDLVPAKHGFDPGPHARFLRQREQQLQRFVRNQVF